MSKIKENFLFVLGCTYKTAPLAVREKYAFTSENIVNFYNEIKKISAIKEAVLLSTCNRFEIYFCASDTFSKTALARLLAASQTGDTFEIENYFFWKEGQDVVEHLFNVAAGLDSQMVGESEILGQTKDFYLLASEKKMTGATLNRVFQKSFQAAAFARSRTGIARGQVSIGNVTVELARRIFGEKRDSKILIFGAGEVGRKIAQTFISRGSRAVTLASRTFENAKKLATEIGGTAIELEAAKENFLQFDIVIGAMKTEVPLLSEANIQAASRARAGVPLFVVDLAVPRNFCGRDENFSDVYFYNLDDLSEIANENLKARLNEVERAKVALAERAERLWKKICAENL